MFEFLIEVLLIYLAYRFIFHFIIPLYRTTKQMSKKVKEMNETLRSQNQYKPTERPSPKKTMPAEGDYIDYEEVKEVR